MARDLILVRHPPVAKAWRTRCYGQSDPGLSRAGRAMITPLVAELAALRPDHVLHSDMQRTRAIALPLAKRLGLAPIAAPLWRERHFGAWEAQSWNAIYRATGNAMDGMIDAPSHFRPGETGETTQELIDRIATALNALPNAGRVLLITHGGPISAARLTLEGGPISALPSLIIPTGTLWRWRT